MITDFGTHAHPQPQSFAGEGRLGLGHGRWASAGVRSGHCQTPIFFGNARSRRRVWWCQTGRVIDSQFRTGRGECLGRVVGRMMARRNATLAQRTIAALDLRRRRNCRPKSGPGPGVGLFAAGRGRCRTARSSGPNRHPGDARPRPRPRTRRFQRPGPAASTRPAPLP